MKPLPRLFDYDMGVCAVACILPLLVCRFLGFALMSDMHSPEVVLQLLRGIVSDLAVGSVAALAGLAVYRYRWACRTLWLGWAALASLNFVHIKENDANANFSFVSLALSNEFVSGSVLTLSNLVSMLAVVLIFAPLYIIAKRNLPGNGRYYAVLLALPFLLAVIPLKAGGSRWLQTNYLEDNLRLALETGFEAHVSRADSKEAAGRFFVKDLSGRQVINGHPGNRNVLLILLESVDENLPRSGLMPYYAELLERNISYSNFISMQAQTNRGLYTVLCGDYPNLLTLQAKSDYVSIMGTERPCLPEVLGRHGYTTAFLQSAYLRYMQKDMFAKKAGFDVIKGARELGPERISGDWGLNDADLFKSALEAVDGFEKEDSPWFLALLTAGTHHPYNVPGKVVPTYEDAVRFLDGSLKYFMNGLQERGVLDDTLVIITSDEAAGRAGHGLSHELSGNHVPAVAIVPGNDAPDVLEGVYAQSDIMLSVLDHLGIDAGNAFGRSMFRSYETGRDLMFANAYLSRVYAYFRDGRLLACSRGMICSAYDIGDGGPFRGKLSDADLDDDHYRLMSAAVSVNEKNIDDVGSEVIFNEEGVEYSGSNFLVGDFRFPLKKGEAAQWRMELQADDPLTAVFSIAQFFYYATDEKINILDETRQVNAGETLEFNFNFIAPFDLEDIRTKISVLGAEGTRYEVVHNSIKKSYLKKGLSEKEGSGRNRGDGGYAFLGHALVAHAMGAVEGHKLTNSREAFVESYRKGIRMFEVDLEYTSDGKIVCFHEQAGGMTREELARTTYKEFMSRKVDGRYMPTDLMGLEVLLKEYPDAYLVTDTKGPFSIVIDFLSLMSERDEQHLKRIIPQIYSRPDYYEIMGSFELDEIVLSLYKSSYNDEEVLDFVSGKPEITAVTVSIDRFGSTLARGLNVLGKRVFVHTVNDGLKAAKLRQLGADGFYTDYYYEQPSVPESRPL